MEVDARASRPSTTSCSRSSARRSARRERDCSRDDRHRRHRPDRVLEALRSQRAPARGRGGRRRGRRRRPHARRHRRRGHLRHGRQRRARRSSAAPGSPSCASPPARAAVAAARARPCSSRPRRWRRAPPTRSSCTARSTSGRGDASVSRIAENNQSRVTPPGWNWYLPFGLDTPAKMYSLWYQRYMYKYGVTNEDFGRYPVVARKHAATNPAAVLLPAADHARGPPGVALDRRADPAQARLLPGERRRRRAGRHRAWSAPATCRSRPVRVAAATPGAPARRRGDVRLLRRRPRRRSRRRRGWAGSSTRRPASRPTTSTWR